MRKEILHAIPGTTMEHDLTKHYPHVRAAALTPELTMPVFELPKGLALTEAVAVTYRDASEKPIDGGLFGVTPEGEIIDIALVDREHDVNTDDDPAHIAFGLVMTIGKLMVRGETGTCELPWSIVDFGCNNLDSLILRPTPSRLAVHAAFCAKLQKNVTSNMTKTRDLFWVGNAERAVAFGPAGLKMAIRTGNEVFTFDEVQKRLQDGEMGDDLPCVMERFGVDYDAACDAVFGRQFQEAISLLNQARQKRSEAEKDDSLSKEPTDESPSPGM